MPQQQRHDHTNWDVGVQDETQNILPVNYSDSRKERDRLKKTEGGRGIWLLREKRIDLVSMLLRVFHYNSSNAVFPNYTPPIKQQHSAESWTVCFCGVMGWQSNGDITLLWNNISEAKWLKSQDRCDVTNVGGAFVNIDLYNVLDGWWEIQKDSELSTYTRASPTSVTSQWPTLN